MLAAWALRETDDRIPAIDVMSNDAGKAPFFIVGSQRSGTTMLRLMLNNHPNIAIPFESGFIPEMARRAETFGDLTAMDNRRRLLEEIAESSWVRRGNLITDLDELVQLPAASYGELVDNIFSSYAARQGKSRWGDKTPGYITELDSIRAALPNARIIHLVRDGRDVAMSMKNVSWGSPHIIRLAQSWRWNVTIGHRMGCMIPDDYLLLRFEDLVRNPASMLRRVCEFIDEPYSEQILDYAGSAEQHMPADSLQWHQSSVKAPDTDKISGWKRRMSHSDVVLFEQVAATTLEEFGYEISGYKTPTLMRRLYYAVIKRW